MTTEVLVEGLSQPGAFPHPVSRLEIIETHISTVILTGPFAYKIRKPVNLGFLDFSTLALRHQDCEDELRLNRRLAPELYLDVVTITGSPANPRIGGDGPVIEYAVKMKQFAPDQCLDRLIEQDRVAPQHLLQLAETLAHFHQHAARAAPDSEFGTDLSIHHDSRQNFLQIRGRVTDLALLSRLADVERLSEARHQALQEEFIQRKAEGWIRECHGDLHLGNLVLLDDRVVPFDCLEFSPPLRWIDTMSEVAFLIMDLIARSHFPLAQTFLNHYLAYSGNYMGLSLLSYYQAYRAMVRAKVSAIRTTQQAGTAEDTEELSHYLNLAARFLAPFPKPVIILLHGVSGSGKTWLAQQLSQTAPLIHIRSDVERKRLLGLEPNQPTPDPADAYSSQRNRETYQRLMALSYAITDAGYPVIVDATFLEASHRQAYQRLAAVADIEIRLLSVHAPEPVLRERIRQRRQQARDASEATTGILDQQLSKQHELTAAENRQALKVDTTGPLDLRSLCQQLGLTPWHD